MSYRILATIKNASRSADFVFYGQDMGLIKQTARQFLDVTFANHKMYGERVDALKHAEANYPSSYNGFSISLKLWESAQSRASWIKVFAEREYVLDLGTGKITSPGWSAIMDADQHDKIYA